MTCLQYTIYDDDIEDNILYLTHLMKTLIHN